MKSFDIFVDKRLIQSDLIVANLPIRNDVAAYYWLYLDSRLTDHIIAEKAVSPSEDATSIAFGANADGVATKYAIIEACPVIPNANAELVAIYPISLEENAVDIQQKLQEVSQKIERVSLPIFIGADDMLDAESLKTAGDANSSVNLSASVNEVKNSIIDDKNGYKGLDIDTSLKLFAVRYEIINSGIGLGADVSSLSLLVVADEYGSLRNKIAISVGINDDDIKIYPSLGRGYSRAVIDAEAALTVERFIDAENIMTLISEVETLAYKSLDPETGFALTQTIDAILRRMRTLAEIDAFDTLNDIDNMTIEELCYTDLVV